MPMKFRGHETFAIRKGWLSKGMKYVSKSEDVFISKVENPMDVLGIGSNMVKSLRYWLPAVGLTQEATTGRRAQTFTEFGTCVCANDKYMEELGTLFLIHYKLASNRDGATSWYYFFNEFNMSEFSSEDFVNAIQGYVLMQGEAPIAIRSLNDDFSCIISTYLPKFKATTKKLSPENNLDCPLGELGLVDILSKERKTYRKVSPSAEALNPWVTLAVIWDRADGRTEIGLNELLTAPNNIGRIFNLDAIVMLDVLHKAEKMGEIKIIRTAGLDVVQLLRPRTFMECVDCYYKSLN